mmetsp:Transcript_27593/g.82261  ORF Transcript_27593/g.82261 Transcript_27593/m.82261 type:complete len:81 (-) Transcript_27593:8-250(-)
MRRWPRAAPKRAAAHAAAMAAAGRAADGRGGAARAEKAGRAVTDELLPAWTPRVGRLPDGMRRGGQQLTAMAPLWSENCS